MISLREFSRRSRLRIAIKYAPADHTEQHSATIEASAERFLVVPIVDGPCAGEAACVLDEARSGKSLIVLIRNLIMLLLCWRTTGEERSLQL